MRIQKTVIDVILQSRYPEQDNATIILSFLLQKSSVYCDISPFISKILMSILHQLFPMEAFSIQSCEPSQPVFITPFSLKYISLNYGLTPFRMSSCFLKPVPVNPPAMKKITFLSCFFTTLFLTLFTASTLTQSIWNADAVGGSVDWNTASNWIGGVPDATKTVAINNCSICPVISIAGNQAKFVEVFGGGKLTIGNGGSLTITNIGGPGMRTHATSQVIVNPAAALNIINKWDPGISVGGSFQNSGITDLNGSLNGLVIDAGASFVNTGQFFIYGSTLNTGILISGNLLNNGLLSIDQAKLNGIQQYTGTINNGPNGTLNVTNTTLNAALLIRTALNNDGTILLDRATAGITMVNGAVVNNNTQGSMTIQGAGTLNRGIINVNAQFNNAGLLTVLDAMEKGIENSDGNFTNEGTVSVSIPGPVGITAYATSIVINKPCARIETTGRLEGFGTFNNQGILTETYSGNSYLSHNPGVVYNLNGGTFTIGSGNAAITDAFTNVWTGCKSAQWEVPENWALGTVPGFMNLALIPGTSMTTGEQPVLNNPAPSVKALTILENASLKINGGGSLSMADSPEAITEVMSGGLLELKNNAVLTAVKFENGGEIDNAGTLQLAGLPGNNAGQFTNDGTLTNKGQITGTTSGQNGSTFINNGQLLNKGTITMPIALFGYFTNHGDFINASSSMVFFTGSAGSSLGNFSNTGTFSNQGTFAITGKMSLSAGLFENSGTLTAVTPLGYTQILMKNEALFTNAGTFDFTTQGIGIENHGTILNHGLIFSEASSIGIFNYNILRNFQTIDLNNSTNRGIYSVNPYYPATFDFTNSGQIYIQNADMGLEVLYGPFTNLGILKIEGGNTGIQNLEAIYNENQGLISIHHTTGIAFLSQGFLDNKGQVQVTDAGTYGLITYNFLNRAGASLLISNTGMKGIYAGGDFHNDGFIQVENTGDDAMYVLGNFHNDACAEISTTGRFNNEGNVHNEGWLRTTYAGMNINAGTFINTGILEDFYDSFDGVYITNNAIRIRPVSGAVGSFILNALEIGGSNPFQVGTTWYQKMNLSKPGGTYNPGVNTFTPSVGVGTHTLYFTIKDLVNSCTKTVGIEVTITNAIAGPDSPDEPQVVLYNYPNPFDENTRVKFSLPFDTEGKLVVFDHTGRLIETMYEGEIMKDELYEFAFEAADKRAAAYLATLVLKDGRTYPVRLVKVGK